MIIYFISKTFSWLSCQVVIVAKPELFSSELDGDCLLILTCHPCHLFLSTKISRRKREGIESKHWSQSELMKQLSFYSFGAFLISKSSLSLNHLQFRTDYQSLYATHRELKLNVIWSKRWESRISSVIDGKSLTSYLQKNLSDYHMIIINWPSTATHKLHT